jgi:hypothetical protein
VFVELQDENGNWVTLPEASDPSHTSNSTGESCPEGWFELHPWLEQYEGADCAGAGGLDRRHRRARTAADNGFETDLGTWVVGDPTEIGSAVNPLDWIVTTDVGFTEGAMTSMTPGDADFRTLYFGFGLENVDTPEARAEMMQLALDYLTAP